MTNVDLVSIESISQVQFGHRQFPQIHVLPCGDWVVMFCWTDDAAFAKCGLLRSSDSGKTWAEQGWSTDTGVLVHLGGQRLGIFDSFYPLDKGGNRFAIQACFSEDGGKTIGPVELSIPVECEGAEIITLADYLQAYFALPCFPWNRFFRANGYPPIAPGWPEVAKKIRFGGAGPSSATVRLSDGRLISMNYCRSTRGPRLPAGFYEAFALESTDAGRSWRKVGAVPWAEKFSGEQAMFGNAGFTEAGLVQLAGGELYIVLRAGSGLPLAASRSGDAGRTWSEPEIVKFHGGGASPLGVFPVMVRMKSGALACVYGRPGINLMIDESGEGKRWRHAANFSEIEHARCRERGVSDANFLSTENVGLAEVAPGELAVTYDLWGWQEAADKPSVRQSIRLARVRVK